MRLENLDNVWVEADLYAAESDAIKEGMEVSVQLSGNAARHAMTISFVNPDLSDGTQVIRVRGSIPNINDALTPGTQASILVPQSAATKMKSLPTGAVIREGKGAHVWVETEPGTYAPRKVTLGREDAQLVEIKEGLNNGDRVVTTGAYLLYSEFVLKKGSEPALEHQH
jgi:Cu(I)/Ag(I) efflux system membrane fusion protein